MGPIPGASATHDPAQTSRQRSTKGSAIGACGGAGAADAALGRRLIDYFEARDLTLEAIVLSHPHVDHAGSVATILAAGTHRLASPLTLYRSDDRSWRSGATWLEALRGAIASVDAGVVTIALQDASHEVELAEGISVTLFAGSGDGPYTSVFVHLRYHAAKILFTGDAHCAYEVELLAAFGGERFRADVLKVTHHGSSSGTAKRVVDAIRAAIAIASTGDDAGHTLEADTLQRLGGRPGPRAVFETVVDGDVVLRTDGRRYYGGVLYEVWRSQADAGTPGLFAADLGAATMPLAEVNRTTSSYPACD